LLGNTWEEATVLNADIVEDAKDCFKVQLLKVALTPHKKIGFSLSFAL